jgi:TraG-like protein, N-terminal region
MALDSYLELFTTMYGWAFASIIWNVLKDTGIIYIPLLVTIVGTWLEAHEVGEEMGGAAWMVRKMEINLFSALFVLTFCAIPCSVTSLSNASLYYQPPATTMDPNPVKATGTSSDSTYQSAFPDVPTSADVPAWWYTIMGLSSGVNAAVKSGLKTGITDFRQLEQMAHIATVEDPQLRAEIQRFYNECFKRARSAFFNAGPPSPQTTNALTTYGKADTDWMGSHAFRDDPALYAVMYPDKEVPGFAFDPSNQDQDMDGSPIKPTFGKPSCKDWWESSDTGLRQKMVNSASTLSTKLGNVFTSATDEQRNDQVAKLLMVKTAPSYVEPGQIMGDDRTESDKAIHAASDVFSAAGIFAVGGVASTTLFALVQFLTISQPLILMGIYAFMPLIVVFSRYSLKVMFLGAIAIFTIKFWSTMWFIARWVDDHLIRAMYPDSNVVMEAITTGLDSSIKRTTLNIVLLSMYAGLPLIWSGMMSWIGFSIGKGIESLQANSVSSAQTAGQKGSDMAGKTAKIIAS